MALEGTLKDFSLADIFQLIGIQKKTGILTLKYEGEVVTVSFVKGNVVCADSFQKKLEDRLGTVLVRSGKISEEKLQKALRTQEETLQRLGHVLIQGNYIDEEELRQALRLQITQIVYRLFRWRDGEYHFSQEEEVEHDRAHFTPVSAESILMEGIKMIDEWPIIEQEIPSFDLVLRKTRPETRIAIVRAEDDLDADLDSTFSRMQKIDEPRSHDGVQLTQQEAGLYGLVDGRFSVQDIIDRSGLGEFETCHILHDLLRRDLVASQDGAQPAPLRPKRRILGPLLERLGYAGLAAAVLVSLNTIGRSPLVGSPQALAPPGALDHIRELIARDRIRRIDEAVQVYYLQKGFYPDDLKELVKGNLAGESTLRDPSGPSFGFIATLDGYRIIAYGPGGVENPALSLTRGRPQPVALEPLPPVEPADAVPAPVAQQ